jgi:hypothetical protein
MGPVDGENGRRGGAYVLLEGDDAVEPGAPVQVVDPAALGCELPDELPLESVHRS